MILQNTIISMSEYEKLIKDVIKSDYYVDMYYLITNFNTEFTIILTIKPKGENISDTEFILDAGKKLVDLIDNKKENKTLLGKNRNTGCLDNITIEVKCKET